ncbi:MAG: Omp28 family outer membrane lipoprotein [Prevotellaceae bacterium]|jgi:thiol-disulfide isomerase/thioredoxin|nr:Omp28 family outer membrane lipoprotein [Prevotellaceae bacterium]
MKKRLFIIAVVSVFIGAFYSCDIIDNSERYVEVPMSEINKTVLLEDFTGQRCVNCPEAHEIARQLQEQYNHAVIVVAIHAGGLSRPALRTPEGEEYDYKFNTTGNWPAGAFDRKAILGDVAKWSAEISRRIENPALVNIEMSCEYDENTRKIDISTTIRALEQSDDELKLQLWLLESNIVARQTVPNESDDDLNYVHHHVLRKAINGTWGETLPKINKEESVTVPFTGNLEKEWFLNEDFAKHVSIVGFVYRASNNEVLQTVEIKLIKE